MEKSGYTGQGDQPRMTRDMLKATARAPRMTFNRNAIAGKIRNANVRSTTR